jgi:hypothetical protein
MASLSHLIAVLGNASSQPQEKALSLLRIYSRDTCFILTAYTITAPHSSSGWPHCATLVTCVRHVMFCQPSA